MTGSALRHCFILVAEDEYLLADDLCARLSAEGATIVGPAPTVSAGRALLEQAERLHGAVLDVNLRGELVFPLADALAGRAVPFVFTTGYDADAIPDRFAQVVRCDKPVRMADVVAALGQVAQG